MTFSKFFKPRKVIEGENKVYLKSQIDLRLLLNQVVYVEGAYSETTNKVISKNHDTIFSKLKHSELSADFLYLPVIVKQMQKQNTSLNDVLNYYFPNIRGENTSSAISSILQTDSISRLLFSSLSYKEEINPGFFRYVGQDSEGFFVYEYFLFVSEKKKIITNQINSYIETISHNPQYTHQSLAKEEEVFFDDEFDIKEVPENISEEAESPFPKNFFEKKTQKQEEDNMDFLFRENVSEKRLLESYYAKPKKEPEKIPPSIRPFKRKKAACSRKTTKLEALSQYIFDDENEPSEKKQQLTEYEIITKIKSDIQKLKELGFYEILLKEIGSVLYENERDKIFQPSQLVIGNDFRIFLPDFNNMEIEMTPLPKSLFVLFLRHPSGINLKTLIDYKIELLEIYKLLSYRETYFDMVESINRICNPIEGSINEKLSRIKEAFLKKMSIDTAKHYIVKGERGMKKKIEIDRSLIVFSNALVEIGLTKTSE